ncbi:serine hydrolase domain-containing protein [Rhodococcoides fascians]|uniref:serine hydrolase domain-containing protein n=1 Tax=Rhodococcoides fascians TaxID=1828 RepID=UPI00050BDEF5|nr:serine hydrolase domain-containing protein [Rhodococcus fascians]
MKEVLDEILFRAVHTGAAPNISAVVADREGIIYSGGAGRRTPVTEDIVDVDTTYRLASMTKMVTTVAALQLVERGEIGLDDPAGAYVPGIDQLQVLDAMTSDGPRFRTPSTQPTIRHLLTHTSGLTYWFWSPEVFAWEQATGTPNVLAGNAAAFTAPLVADPGTRFEYGMNTDYLGKIIEVVSGNSLPRQVHDHVTGPLEMTHTTFSPSVEQRESLVPVYALTDKGWSVTDIDWPQEPDWWAGGHALYSTPRDYIRFQQMLLRRGELDGVRILSEKTVREAFTPQIGKLDMPATIPAADPASSSDYHSGAHQTWGWGLQLNREQRSGLRAPLSGSWAGLANTHFWVDPTNGIAASIYSQFLPFVTPGFMAVYEEFERAVYATHSA